MWKIYQISAIAKTNPGYPFRGQVEAFSAGSTRVVQMKNVDDLHRIKWSSLITTHLKGRKTPNWLKQSDILFLARGNRNYAVYLDKMAAPTVCSPHFFQIRVTDAQTMLPAFLAWQINQPPIQKYLAKSTEGSAIGNIRRSVLEAMPVVVPSLSQQSSIVALDDIHLRQHWLLQRQIDNNRLMMNAIAHQLASRT